MVMNKKPPRPHLMESLRSKKVLSECSNVPGGLYLGRGEKVDDGATKRSASSLTHSESANVSFRAPRTLKAALAEDHPVPSGTAPSLTPNKKGDAAAQVSGEKTPGQAMPSVGLSAFTAADFGCTPESLPRQRMGESQSLFKKWRRRSTIGARGSPENNSLIQYIAHQKGTKTEKPLSQASPLKRHSVQLKDKIAAFQSSFQPLEETEERLVQAHSIFKEGGPECLESKGIAVDDQPTAGERTSADLQVCCIVSPLLKPLIPGTAVLSKALPALQQSTAESRRLPFEATPVTNISKTARGIQSQRISEELSSGAAAHQSCKKVRFAEKEILEIFDQSKPPVTPLQKGHLPSRALYPGGACLRSVLKKPQELFDDSREGNSTPLASRSCGLLQIESNPKRVNDIEEDGKNLDAKVLAALPLVGAPLLRGVGPGSPSGSRNDSPNDSTRTPIKQPLSQPNFDSEDDLPPGPSEEVHARESAVNSDPEETDNSSPEPQAACSRITRSSLKRKKLVGAAATETRLPAEMLSERAPTSQPPKPNRVKTTTASRRKVFGAKRRRKKKEQKTLYGQRETVSKKPLLSPIPEMKEDLSFASHQTTPRLQMSILDYSSDACVEHLDKTARKENGGLQNPIVDHDSLNISLELAEEDALTDIRSASSQLRDAAVTAGEDALPWDLPEKTSPAKPKSAIDTNEQVLESDCSSEETEMRKELEFLSEGVTDGKSAGGRELDRPGDLDLQGSASALMGEGEVSVNLKRFPRRSRRLSRYLPSIEDVLPEMLEDGVCTPRSPLEELLPSPQTGNGSGLLKDLQRSIEESFRYVPTNNPKRVRRSTRRLKDTENSGLAWIDVPADDRASRAVPGCASKAQKCPSSPEELERLCQNQGGTFRVLSPTKEERARAPIVVGPVRLKAGRRRSISALCPGGHENVAPPPRRNRRASLGYRSDRCYRKDSELRQLLVHPPTIVI